MGEDKGTSKDLFPLSEIMKEYKGTSKDLSFDEDFIEKLLKTQKDDPMCYTILALLMPMRICTDVLHKDHLHPAAAFLPRRLDAHKFLSDNHTLRKYYENPENWNTIPNLHLLDGALNRSKTDGPLEDWVRSQNVSISMLAVPKDAPLDFASFPKFIEMRAANLTSILEKLGS